MVGVGRDPWRFPSPTPLPEQVHLQQDAQEHVQLGFDYIQNRGLHSPSGKPVPMLHHPPSKEVLPHV